MKHAKASKKNISCSEFTHIVHISDIHIKPLERHDEYLKVFQSLTNKIKSFKNKHKIAIAITGDIFDNKTVFKPETFNLCKMFMKDLSQQAPVFVIAGNHDMLETNTRRLDALTPIVNDIPNLFYFSLSGCYKVNDYVFAVSSLYDKEITKIENKDKLNTVIGMYHGMLADTIENERACLTSEDFINYDIVMLGDIHKRQMIKPHIGYSGSLIQQNYGEPLNHHGGLLWDIKSKTASQFDIENDHGFVDIVCNDGIWVNKQIELPKHVYCRFIASNTSDYEIKEIIKQIETKTESCIVTIKTQPRDSLKHETQNNSISNESDMLTKECDILKLDIDTMLSLHNVYKQEALIKDNNEYSSCVWKPIKMEFKNLFGYNNSKVHTINFSDNVYSIQAPNGNGKTSIVNALIFGIYGKTPLVPFGRGHTYDIINNLENNGFVNIYFMFNNVHYLIKRYNNTSNKRYRTEKFINTKLQSYTFHVELYEYGNNFDNPDPKKISETGNATDAVILKMFGDIEYFLHSNLMDKEASKDIASSTAQTERLRILKKIFHLDYYDEYKSMNNSRIKSMKKTQDALMNEIKGMEATYQEIDKDVLQNTITNEKNELKEEEKGLQQLQETLTQKEELFQSTLSKLEIANLKLDNTKHHKSNYSQKELIQKIKNHAYYNKQLINEQSNSVAWYDSEIKGLNKLNKEYTRNILHKGTKEEIMQEIEDLESEKENIGYIEIHEELKEEEKENYYNFKNNQQNCSNKINELENKSCIENDLSLQEIIEEIENVKQQRNELLKRSSNTKSRKQLETELYYIRQSIVETNETEEQINQTIQNLRVEIELLKRKTTNETIDEFYCDKPNDVLMRLKSSLERKLIDPNSIIIPPKILIDEENQELLFNANAIIDDCRNRLESYYDSIYCDKEQIIELLDVIDTLPYKKVSSSYINSDHDNIFKRLDKKNIENIETILKSCCDNTIDIGLVETLHRDIFIQESLVDKYQNAAENNKKHDELSKLKQENEKILNNINNIQTILDINEYNENKQKLITYEKKLNNINKIKQAHEIQQHLEDLKSTSPDSIESELNELDEYNQELIEHMNYVNLKNYKAQYKENEIIIEQLKNKIDNHKKYTNYSKIAQQIHNYNQTLTYLTRYEDNNIEIEKLQNQKQEQKEKENFLLINDQLTYIELKESSVNLSIEKEKLQQELLPLKKNCSDSNNKITLLKSNIQLNKERIKTIETTSTKIKQCISDIKDIQIQLSKLEDYDKLISNKGLPSKILYDIIKSIEYYINSLITSFINYRLEFAFDYDKQYLEILCYNTKTEKCLSFQRLSGYEKCVVRIALKRAINKFSCNSKSSLAIIDEAFDCIDENNFTSKLPQLISLIAEDYDVTLIISQRDISHIADKTIKIRNNAIAVY